MKKLIGILALMLIMLFAVPAPTRVDSKDKEIQTGWSCRCQTCGKAFSGSNPVYTCDYCGGQCNCVRKPPVRL